MRTAIAMPLAAVLVGGATVSTMAVAPASAATTTATVTATQDNDRSKNRASRTKPRSAPIALRFINKYNIGRKQLREITAAKAWANTSKARAVRQCESGGYYGINTGNGYYGAYQFHAGTWRGIGGGRYAPYAHQAPKFAQDHMAYRLWKRSGWGPWGCA